MEISLWAGRAKGGQMYTMYTLLGNVKELTLNAKLKSTL